MMLLLLNPLRSSLSVVLVLSMGDYEMFYVKVR
uniref:Uncharacterized protein n=1 Tax=Anguilla anguilla TaxID=7936 RepID=A0A0E9P816_ANGAN